MPELRIRCATCNSDRDTTHKNTKYCHVCRLASNLLFVGDKQKKCFACGQDFAPLSRNDLFCGKCDRNARSHNVEGYCAFCEREDQRLMRDEVRICVECSKNPEKRPAFLHAVLTRQDQQIENPVRLPAAPEPGV